MRLQEIDRGDSIVSHLFISFISLVSRMRLPDAARVALYHKDFFSVPMGEWTQAAMRGSSEWSVGERELMAALVAKWNSSSFCVRAHGAVSAKELERSTVDAALADYHAAPISERLKVALEFLETMTLRPTELTSKHAKAVLAAGVSAEALKDAIAVGAVFNIVTRYANTLDFAIPTADEFHRAATMLLKRGYGS
jgi:uncharacterized peroxidase-related enzyme